MQSDVPRIDPHHVAHTIDLTATLKSELAAANYKRDRLLNELAELKGSLNARDAECETALIGSLQSKIQAIENRERAVQNHSENMIQTLHREKNVMDERFNDLVSRVRRLEGDLSREESHREQIRAQLHDLIRRLCICLAIDVSDESNLSPELIIVKTGEVVAELQRNRNKLASTCESLHSCEAELLQTRTTACNEKQRLDSHLEELETRCRQSERDLKAVRDRLRESENIGSKLREELHGFEARCCRLQNTIDRMQSDRLQYLRNLASIVSLPEPCETLIRDKVRDFVDENQALELQLHNLRDQMSIEMGKFKNEAIQKTTIEERLEKALHDLHHMKNEHMTFSEYLVRLSRVLAWNECSHPPAPGADTNLLSEKLLERVKRLVAEYDHHHIMGHKHLESFHSHLHSHTLPHPHSHPHHSKPLKLRRERSFHDLPNVKEPTAMYNLQRQVHSLKDIIQRKDLQIELSRRKLALMEEAARGKCIAQKERDEALCRAKRTAKQTEKTSQQLVEAKAQIAELKAQLADSAENKICALERGRKIEDLQARLVDMETEKSRLIAQLQNFKIRCRSTVDSSIDKTRRDEQAINNLKDDIARLRVQLSETNHKLSQLQTFRTSVARLIHLRDIPHSSLLQRLQTLCHAHQEFTMLSRRYESVSPVADHSCPRYGADLLPPSTHCRPLSSSPGNLRRFDDSGLDEHFDDDFHVLKKKLNF